MTSRRPCYYCKQPACFAPTDALCRADYSIQPFVHAAKTPRRQSGSDRARSPPTFKGSTPQKTKLHPPIPRKTRGKATPAPLAELENGRTIVDVFLDVFISRLFVQPAPSCSMNNNNKLVACAGDGWMDGERRGGGGLSVHNTGIVAVHLV